jgi:hypothetical protein
MKIYFITLISAYEEVHQKQEIDLKKMNEEIEKNKLDESKTPFIREILERQIISHHTKQTVSVFNPYGEEKGSRRTRTQMFFDSFEKAKKAIENNHTDLFESGSWGSPTFAVIEEYHEGFCLVDKRWFFEINFDDKNQIVVKEINEPLWARGTCNYAY